MADTTALKNRTRAAIKANDNQEITGPVLQQTLLDIIDELDLYPELQEAINTEKSARQSSDNTLQEAINAEKSARQSSDNTLQEAINTEKNARQSTDNTLQEAITAINTVLNEGYICKGIATPNMNPGTITGQVFYFAVSSGTYTYFSNIVVAQGINILTYNGSAWSKDVVYAIDARPKKASQNLVTSGGAFDNIGALDVSELNATENPHTLAQYADLSAALTAIPTDYKKGGMSIKFLSDNKYVQFRYMGTSTSNANFNNVSNWQGVDAEPTNKSKNLVESGGIFSVTQDLNNAVFDYEPLEELNPIDGYIKSDGDIVSSTVAVVRKYSLTNITKVKIINKLKSGNSRLYAFYSSSEFSSSTLVGTIGPEARLSESDEYYVDVPSTATYLGVTNFRNTEVGAFDYENKSSKINELSIEVNELKSDINTKMVEMTGHSTPGSYINSSYNIATTSGFIMISYNLNDISKVRITNKARTGNYVTYVFYNSSTFQESNVVGTPGPLGKNNTQDIFIENVPDNAAYLVISVFLNVEYKAESYEDMDISTEIPAIEAELLENKKSNYAFSFDATNLLVAYNNNGTEYTYWFKKCMANDLFTFYKVGYRTVLRNYPSVEGIMSDSNIIRINETSSDNIGPFLMSNGGWVGGNHTIEDSGRNMLTAKTDSFSVFIDGILMSSYKSSFAKSVTINVQNTIYDPAILPDDPSATILTSPLCTEYVTYVINKNTIEVAVRHKFSSSTNNSIDTYYGMQSMFNNEDYYITPNGEHTSWVSSSTIPGRFIKENFPHFNRFVEKNMTNGVYQASYLLDDFGLGLHNYIPENGSKAFMFTRGQTGKNYHHLIASDMITTLANKSIKWRGSYTFFHSPIVDDANVFAYIGSVFGKDAIFVNTKQAFFGSIPVPSEFALREVSVRECYGITDGDGGTNFQCGGDGFYIESVSTGSLILIFD